MHAPVELAVSQIKDAFTGHTVEAVDDGSGGAFVRVHDVAFGDQYEPKSGWVAFHITHTYPHSDVYGHYLPAGLKRPDGKPLGEGFHPPREMPLGQLQGTATFVSRKSNRWNPAHDTAAIKLQMVLNWIASR